MELPSPRAWLRQRSEALDSLQELLSSLKAPCPFRKHWGEEKKKKIKKKNLGAGKDFRPSNLFGLAPALQTCDNRLSSSLVLFQMDEMGIKPSQAGREACGLAPRAGGSRRRAASHTHPGREGRFPSLASQVNSSPSWARALARGSGKFRGPQVSGCSGLFLLSILPAPEAGPARAAHRAESSLPPSFPRAL